MSNKLSPLSGQIVIVTGGIGSGKSYIMRCLEKMGFSLFNSDEVIRELINGQAYEQIAKLAPAALRDGVVDRAVLAKLVFDDDNLLNRLEDILYPLLLQRRAGWIEDLRAASGKSMAIEIPLFFEKQVEVEHDIVLATICDLELQKQRVLSRGKMDAKTLDSVLKRQVSNEYRVNHADLVIDTNGSHEESYAQLLKLKD